MALPFFSIIIPTYNCLDKLKLTLESILGQSFRDFECLLIDAESTDGTREFSAVSAGEDRRVVSVSEPDRGLYDAMNKGIRRAGGKYLYFIGAGDCLTPGILQSVADFLERQPQQLSIFLYGDVLWMSESRIHYGPFNSYLLTRVNPCHQSVFYDRRIFQMIGEFELTYSLCADWVCNFKCFGHAAIRKVRMNAVIANYEGTGLSSRSRDMNFERDRLSLVRKYLGLSPAIYLVCRRFCSLLMAPLAHLKRKFLSA